MSKKSNRFSPEAVVATEVVGTVNQMAQIELTGILAGLELNALLVAPVSLSSDAVSPTAEPTAVKTEPLLIE